MSEIQQATPDVARRLTDRIKVAIEGTWQLIQEAYLTRTWAVLGYDSWDVYCSEEFGTSRLRLPREEREEVVASLRESGLSVRAIAAATGLGKGTVERSLSPVPNGTPEKPVTGVDGKSYAPKRPAPSSHPAPTHEADLLGGDDWLEPAGAESGAFAGPLAEDPDTERAPNALHPDGAGGALFDEPADRAAEDARLDASLAAEMEDSAVVFRANFRPKVTAAYVMAKDADVGRITQVYAALGGDRDALIRDLRFIRDFCDRASEALSKTVQIRSAGGAR